MSDYSDDDFEMSGGATYDALNNKAGGKAANASPFKAKGGYGANDDDIEDDIELPQDDDDDDVYEDDDFDDEEEEQFKKTAVEFAKKLQELRQSTKIVKNESPARPVATKPATIAAKKPSAV